VRTEWEHTIETMRVLEEVSPDTMVFHQTHKRIWPAAQRDSLFWSHIRHNIHLSLSQLMGISLGIDLGSKVTSSIYVRSVNKLPLPEVFFLEQMSVFKVQTQLFANISHVLIFAVINWGGYRYPFFKVKFCAKKRELD
jgi:hypothetical protein